MAGTKKTAREDREKKRACAGAGGNQMRQRDALAYQGLGVGMLSALSVNDYLTFNDLKKLLDTTDGNMSVHARKLEEAGYVTCTKSFAGRVPRTDYKLTAAGRRALERYLDHMEA